MIGKRKKAQKVTLGILGCMAQNRGSNLSSEIKGVNLIVGTQKFHRVSEYLDRVSSDADKVQSPLIDINEEEGSQNTINQHLTSPKNQVSAFVSIMQGCNMNCSFCIVPKTRGSERYRQMNEICDEIKSLVIEASKKLLYLDKL